MTCAPMKPVRIQLSRKKGFRLPPNTVKVSWPSKWGNPFIVGVDGDAEHCVAEYRRMLTGVPMIAWPKDPNRALAALHYAPDDLQAEEELRGKNLACWCPLPKPGEPDICHAAILIELANK